MADTYQDADVGSNPLNTFKIMDYNILSYVFALMDKCVTLIEFICLCIKFAKWCKKKRGQRAK
ncbi:MAG: hypothetical protein NC044_01815 [Prevotella sp.]|nr:hypothetical protein [Bacteroides sp.]MCM1445130.1 hypothetical protein [Prevotella sp.]